MFPRNSIRLLCVTFIRWILQLLRLAGWKSTEPFVMNEVVNEWNYTHKTDTTVLS